MKATYLKLTHEGVDTVTTGWGSRKPTPEERVEKEEEDFERMDKVVTVSKNNLNMMELKTSFLLAV